MPQFYILFYAIIRSWRPKGGGMAQCPPKYVPALDTQVGNIVSNIVQSSYLLCADITNPVSSSVLCSQAEMEMYWRKISHISSWLLSWLSGAGEFSVLSSCRVKWGCLQDLLENGVLNRHYSADQDALACIRYKRLALRHPAGWRRVSAAIVEFVYEKYTFQPFDQLSQHRSSSGVKFDDLWSLFVVFFVNAYLVVHRT